MLALELLDEVVDKTVIEILTTKVSITSGGLDFEDTLDGQEGNIESSSSEIVDNDAGFTAFLVETVCDSCGGGFIDDTENLETSDRAGILGRLTLRVVEVCKSLIRKERVKSGV